MISGWQSARAPNGKCAGWSARAADSAQAMQDGGTFITYVSAPHLKCRLSSRMLQMGELTLLLDRSACEPLEKPSQRSEKIFLNFQDFANLHRFYLFCFDSEPPRLAVFFRITPAVHNAQESLLMVMGEYEVPGLELRSLTKQAL